MMPQVLLNSQLQLLLLSLVPGLPLLLAFAFFVRPMEKTALRLAPYSALPALAAALFLKSGVNLEVAWFFMGGRMGLDFVGRQFLLLASLVWFISCLFAQGYLAKDKRRSHFFFFYLISMAFNFGLILAQDMLGFYLFFGLMSFSAYGLIVHTRSKEARLAGKVYIILVMLGEVLLFSGMLLLASQLPDMELSTIARSKPATLSLFLLFLGFGIKAGALPLHVWLPLAHPVAPLPASAVLSGVMIKAGLLGWLRFLPVELNIALPGWGGVFVVMGAMAAFYGVVIGLTQKDAKTILAYSSISQMGLMTMIVGCGLLSPTHWPQVIGAVSVYALHHGLAKASLFLGTGLIQNPKGGTPTIWVMVLLLFASLALAGLPFTSGAIAKIAVKEIVQQIPMPWSVVLGYILPLSAVFTMLLLCHFLKIMVVTPSSKPSISLKMVIPWSFLMALVGGLMWVWPQRLVPADMANMKYVWQGLWPVLLGGIVMTFSWKWWAVGKGLELPAGDILWFACGWSKKRNKQEGAMVGTDQLQGRKNVLWLVNGFQNILVGGRGLEKRLMRWVVVGCCYLFICLLYACWFLTKM